MSSNPPSPHVLVVENEREAGIGNFRDWLRQAGLVLDVLRPHAGDPVPAATGASGLIVLGGPMGANDDDVAPWLPATRQLLRQAARAGTPTLGICLGAQLLAVACGGQVEPGANGCQIGAVEEMIDAPGDRLMSGLPSSAPFVHWHCDTITRLPPGSAVLAHSDTYPWQAFRVGSRAWGVLFHPEAAFESLATWAALNGLDTASTEAIIRRAGQRRGEIAIASAAIAANFARIVTAAAAEVRAAR